MKLLLTAIVAMGIVVGCATGQTDMNRETIRHLDLNRYMGLWYEIARFPNKFEKNLVGVTAEYKLLPDGMVEVINSGHVSTLDGEKKVARGRGKMPDKNEPGRLKVSFFLWFYADYWILDLASDYSYAVIGSSSDDYLWILSRTPTLHHSIIQGIVNNLQNRGYDTSKLYFCPQP